MPCKENHYVWLQYGAAITASITSVGYGSIMSWTSPALTYLKSQESEIAITKEQTSWIAPLLPIGLIIGHFINPLLINRLGRKWTLMIFAVPQIISWFLIYCTKNYNVIYVARIMGGIGYGGGVCAVTVYLSEIGTPRNRGIFLSMIKFSLSLGIVFTLLLGGFVSYNYMNLGHLVMPIIFVVLFFFLPDSYYFLEKNKRENSINSDDYEICMRSKDSVLNQVSVEKKDFELKEESRQEGHTLLTDNSIKRKKSIIVKLKESDIWKLFSTSNNIKALTIIVFVVAQDCFSGHMVLTYFSQQMLSYNGSLLSGKQGAIFLSLMKLTSSVVATQVMERVKRRILYFSTGILSSLFQGMIAIFFFLEDQKINVSSFSFIPFVGLIVFEFSVTMGTSNLFYVLQGELFESDVKGLAVTLAKIIYMILGFISIIMYQTLIEAFNAYVLFLIFCLSGVILCFLTISLLPETKGRNIEEIQMLLKEKTFC